MFDSLSASVSCSLRSVIVVCSPIVVRIFGVATNLICTLCSAASVCCSNCSCKPKDASYGYVYVWEYFRRTDINPGMSWLCERDQFKRFDSEIAAQVHFQHQKPILLILHCHFLSPFCRNTTKNIIVKKRFASQRQHNTLIWFYYYYFLPSTWHSSTPSLPHLSPVSHRLRFERN